MVEALKLQTQDAPERVLGDAQPVKFGIRPG
jgi:hypothetical protein